MKDIRHAIQEASETTVRLLNYKKSGKAFWNMFTLAPMADVDGTARFLIGVQVDVTAVEEALPESLKATNAGPQVPKGAANAISAGQWTYCTAFFVIQQQLCVAQHCMTSRSSTCTLCPVYIHPLRRLCRVTLHGFTWRVTVVSWCSLIASASLTGLLPRRNSAYAAL